MPRPLWSALILFAVLLPFGCSEKTEEAVEPYAEPPRTHTKQAGKGAATGRKKPKTVSDAGYGAAGLSKVRRPPYELLPPEQVAALADEPDADEMTMVFVGDIMLENDDRAHLRAHGYRYPFAGTAPLLQKAVFPLLVSPGTVRVKLQLLAHHSGGLLPRFRQGVPLVRYRPPGRRVPQWAAGPARIHTTSPGSESCNWLPAESADRQHIASLAGRRDIRSAVISGPHLAVRGAGSDHLVALRGPVP